MERGNEFDGRRAAQLVLEIERARAAGDGDAARAAALEALAMLPEGAQAGVRRGWGRKARRAADRKLRGKRGLGPLGTVRPGGSPASVVFRRTR